MLIPRFPGWISDNKTSRAIKQFSFDIKIG